MDKEIQIEQRNFKRIPIRWSGYEEDNYFLERGLALDKLKLYYVAFSRWKKEEDKALIYYTNLKRFTITNMNKIAFKS